MVNVCVLLTELALVYVATYTFVPVLSGMLLIWRAVDVNPLGPVQLQLPPVTGCGPRSTAVVVEATVAVDSSVQVVPPFTEMYGVIALAVPPLTVTVNVSILLQP
jgi:hypothetical protein